MLYAWLRLFWPALTDEEVRKFAFFSLTFFMLIFVYWVMRIARDVVFFTVAFPEELGWAVKQGALFQPMAKIWSVIIIACAVGIYSKLVDLFARHQLFYIIGSFYIVTFSVAMFLLMVNDYYGSSFLGSYVLATTGWVNYFAVESAGSILIALFWSYVVSLTNTSTAKLGFPMIVLGGQLGALSGSSMSYVLGKHGQVWPSFLLGIIGLVFIIGLIYYIRHYVVEYQPSIQQIIDNKKEERGSFFKSFVEGIYLIATRPYLLGVFVISTVYEVVAVIVEYQMYRQAVAIPEYATKQGFNTFMSIFGIATNSISCLIVLIGTSFFLGKLGLRKSLFIYPTVVLCLLCAVYCCHVLSASVTFFLWVLFSSMVMIKGLNFALNDPIKHIVYIPTSRDVQFKAKGWVDTFGTRSAKMGGAQISNMFKHNLIDLMNYGTFLSIILIACGMGAALFVGRKNHQLVTSEEVIQ